MSKTANKNTTDDPKTVPNPELVELLNQIDADSELRRPLPDPEDAEPVKRARAGAEQVRAKRAALAAEIATLEGRMGLRAGESKSVEALAPRLVAEGKADDADIEAAGRLWSRAATLADAEAIAVRELQKTRDRVRAELAPAAALVAYDPARRATAAALLHLLACLRTEIEAADELRAARYTVPPGSGIPTDGLADLWHNPTVLALVADGTLSREDVKAACPHMSGI